MSTSFYDLKKYAATGQASSEMTQYDKMRALSMAGGKIKTLTGVPPLAFKANGKPLISLSMLGNGQQQGTPTSDAPIMPTFCGVMTGNLLPAPVKGTVENAGITIESDGNGNIHVYGTRTSGTSPAIQLSEPIVLDGTYYVHIRNNNSAPSSAFLLNAVGSSSSVVNVTLTSKDLISQVSVSNVTVDKLAIYVTPGTSIDMTIRASIEVTNAITNYEPFGWKVPVTMRGANLFDKNDQALYYSSTTLGSGRKWSTSSGGGVVLRIPCLPLTDYTVSLRGDYLQSVWNIELTAYDATPTSSYSVPTTIVVNGKPSNLKTSFTTLSDTKYILIQFSSAYIESGGNSNIMLNTGSTAQPYEPYREPVTTPLYLGQVQTMRRVKKLVLTGTETWYESTGWKKANTSAFYVAASGVYSGSYTGVCAMSTHFLGVPRSVADKSDTAQVATTGTYIIFRVPDSIATTATAFKQFLADEYAAGTPVVVWYVLANEQTAIVNEPLCKIGDYADELHISDEVTIPTANGSNTMTVDTDLQPSEITITYTR